MKYIGLGKTKFYSSVALVDGNEVEVFLSERLSRKKCSGEWPSETLKRIHSSPNDIVGENRDVHHPKIIESVLNSKFPFFEYLKKNKLEKYSSHFNEDLKYISHHEAHAYAALAMSPFDESIILVKDGAGSSSVDFSEQYDFREPMHEECSIYLQKAGQIKLISKRWIKFQKSKKHQEHTFCEGSGLFYEKISEFIFDSSTSSGKVMGLAPFGEALEFSSDRMKFLDNLDWAKSFKGKSKKDWENSNEMKLFQNLSATAQRDFESDNFVIIDEIKKLFPNIENIILTGGCALNCTFNAKLYYSNLFKNIYIPPFPGDESIGFGVAQCLKLKNTPTSWRKISWEKQQGYFGPIESIPSNDKTIPKLEEKGIKYKIIDDLINDAVDELKKGNVIGWFQERSESGPRALGNRSILARADRKNLKNYLNENIKFRESFRPYGCSVIHEVASEYFDVHKDFFNPYMSFAVRVRTNYYELLKEVTHVDGTSRMQTVLPEQNKIFYDLINEFGKRTNLYCLLNTSLNVMGEPIAESFEDAINLFINTPIDTVYIGNIKLLRS